MCNIPESEELSKGATWVIYVDGSSISQRSVVGVTLTSSEGKKFEYAIKLDFATTNNEVEYEAVLTGLSKARGDGSYESGNLK
jgi:ribonuclease HI